MARKIGIFLLISLLIGAGALLLVRLLSAPAESYSFFDNDGPMVIAHQGGEELRPSNTMASFSHAMELGVDVLEMDVHSTADGELVLIHDDTVDRTTDGTGRVHDLTLAEIQQLDAGHYWTADEGQTYPYRGQGIQIATLEEVLTAFPGTRLNIEIKQLEPSIAGQLCDTLRRFDMTDRALVASFHPESINEFRTACPDTPTSMVESEIRMFYVLHRLGLASLYSPPAEAIQVPEEDGGIYILSERFIGDAQGIGLNVHAWTIDETEDMARLLERGLDGIITDRPDRMLELLGR